MPKKKKTVEKKSCPDSVLAKPLQKQTYDVAYYTALLKKIEAEHPDFYQITEVADHESTDELDRALVQTLLQRVSILNPESADFKFQIQLFNSCIYKHTNRNPKLFLNLLRKITEGKEEPYIAHCLSILFQLKFLTDHSLPDIHERILLVIHNEMQAKLLSYYLTFQEQQADKILKSGIIPTLLVKYSLCYQMPHKIEQSKVDLNNANTIHLLKSLILLRPKVAERILEHIRANIPEDFPWPLHLYPLWQELQVYFSTLKTIGKNFEKKIQNLLSEVPIYHDLVPNTDLIFPFYMSTCQINKNALENFLLHLVKLPINIAPIAIEHALNHLLKMTQAWPAHLDKTPIHIFKNIFNAYHLQIELFNQAKLFPQQGELLDLETIQSILQSIATFSATPIKNIYKKIHRIPFQRLSRPQYDLVKLLNAMRQTISTVIQELPNDSPVLLGINKQDYAEISLWLFCDLETPEARLFAFEDSETYKKILAKYPEIPSSCLEELKGQFLEYLCTEKIETVYQEVNKKNALHEKILLLQLIMDLSKELRQKNCLPSLFEKLEKHCLNECDKLCHQLAAKLSLNTEEMRQILIIQGLAAKRLDMFYQAYINQDFNKDQNELSIFIQQISQTNNLTIANYFASVIKYYLQSNPEKSKLINNNLLKTLNKRIRQLEYNVSKEAKTADQRLGKEPNPTKEDRQEALTKGRIPPLALGEKAPNTTKDRGSRLSLLSMEEALKLFRSFRKYTLYSQYIDLFTRLQTQLNQDQDSLCDKASATDKANFNKAYTRLKGLLSEIISVQANLLSYYKDKDYESFDFEWKEETLRLQEQIAHLESDASIGLIFYLHNQLLSNLLAEIRAQKTSLISQEEANITKHIDEFLLIPFTEMSKPQQKTLFWLEELAIEVEAKALADPLFTHCKPGFLVAGVYGSFIAKAFNFKEMPLLFHHSQDIDSSFYLNEELSNHQPLSQAQLRKLETIFNSLLPETARRKARSFPNFSTWHGFEYEGQECDITLKSRPPIPVVSHCCILFRLKDKQVQFLENGEHALLHIKANRLNIIAPKEQHTDPIIMAHVLKKMYTYLQNGVKLTLQSKIILGNLLADEAIAYPTICRFISFYGKTNPDAYSKMLTEIRIPYILHSQKNHTSLAEYLIRRSLLFYMHLDTEKVLASLIHLSFLPLFLRPAKLSLKDIRVFIHEAIQQLEIQDRQTCLAYNPYPLFSANPVPSVYVSPEQRLCFFA